MDRSASCVGVGARGQFLPFYKSTAYHSERDESERAGKGRVKRLFSLRIFCLFMLLMLCAGAAEQAMSQWASYFAESALGVTKLAGDLLGVCMFAFFMGLGRVPVLFRRPPRHLLGSRYVLLGALRDMLLHRRIFRKCVCFACGLRAYGPFGFAYVALCIFACRRTYKGRRNGDVRASCGVRRYRMRRRSGASRAACGSFGLKSSLPAIAVFPLFMLCALFIMNKTEKAAQLMRRSPFFYRSSASCTGTSSGSSGTPV